MRVLLDTNIILDHLLEREPFVNSPITILSAGEVLARLS
ncbi:hypothetical protein PL8927_540050 [Planktothrix serta PCC 8927]|uniref:PIN domain-containing protein n=1 Tax=Planktothrix serta PCC 8927 TaxID=671068 RepID=A0A7Z9DX82_9CYAN|nr:hypothetical protein PL8927_540050 [Planktothrix serta PCC 8927]